MDSKQQKETPTDGGGERSGSGRSNDGKGENDGRGMRESSNSAGGKGLTDDDPEAIEVRSLRWTASSDGSKQSPEIDKSGPQP